MKRWRTDARRAALPCRRGARGLPDRRCRRRRGRMPGARIRSRRAAQLLARGTGARRRLHPQRDRDRQDSRRDPADPAARQAGLFREFRRARRRDPAADDRGHHLSSVFDVEADHLGRGDDAGRGRQALARRSRLEIHPGLCRREGRRRETRATKAGAGARTAQPPDHDRGPAAPHLGPHLRLLWRQRGAKALCEGRSVRRRFRQCRVRRAHRKTAAGRTAGNAVGLRPFDRRARPRHRGGVGKIAVSVREGAAARSARHDRDRVLRRRSREAAAHRRADAGRSLHQSDRRDQRSDAAAALGIRRGGHGRDHRRLCALRADAAERRHVRRAGVTSSPRRSR